MKKYLFIFSCLLTAQLLSAQNVGIGTDNPGRANKVKLLRPVAYEMIHNDPAHEKSIGFIAQEVKQLFPELVSVLLDTANGYKNVTDLHALNYSGFGIIAIKAIQEQQSIIERQGQSLQTMKAQLDELEKTVNKLFTKETKPTF